MLGGQLAGLLVVKTHLVLAARWRHRPWLDGEKKVFGYTPSRGTSGDRRCGRGHGRGGWVMGREYGQLQINRLNLLVRIHSLGQHNFFPAQSRYNYWDVYSKCAILLFAQITGF